MVSDEIIDNYVSNIKSMQSVITALMAEEPTDEETLNVIGFYVEAIKTDVESLRTYKEAMYSL